MIDWNPKTTERRKAKIETSLIGCLKKHCKTGFVLLGVNTFFYV